QASEFAPYIILALVLLLRPRGLFGQEGFFE
ncbi:branched-chain amino acid ABC transporter permease, partial [Thermus scotoductus]